MRLLLMMGLILMLSACAIADESSSIDREQPPRIAITPIVLTLTYDGICADDPAALEVWIGSGLATRETLTTLWQNFPPQSTSELLAMIERLVIMRNGIASLPAPDCTAQAHAILVTSVDTTLATFQAVYNDDPIDITAERTIIMARLDQLAILIDSLLDELQVIIGIE